MQLGKYAQLERERRFLLGSLPPDLSRSAPDITIHDRYLHQTRFRLRRMVASDSTSAQYKLSQKYLHTPGNFASVIKYFIDFLKIIRNKIIKIGRSIDHFSEFIKLAERITGFPVLFHNMNGQGIAFDLIVRSKTNRVLSILSYHMTDFDIIRIFYGVTLRYGKTDMSFQHMRIIYFHRELPGLLLVHFHLGADNIPDFNDQFIARSFH